jgi:hypothetical protein
VIDVPPPSKLFTSKSRGVSTLSVVWSPGSMAARRLKPPTSVYQMMEECGGKHKATCHEFSKGIYCADFANAPLFPGKWLVLCLAHRGRAINIGGIELYWIELIFQETPPWTMSWAICYGAHYSAKCLSCVTPFNPQDTWAKRYFLILLNERTSSVMLPMQRKDKLNLGWF